jgi:hypothetical protein
MTLFTKKKLSIYSPLLNTLIFIVAPHTSRRLYFTYLKNNIYTFDTLQPIGHFKKILPIINNLFLLFVNEITSLVFSLLFP